MSIFLALILSFFQPDVACAEYFTGLMIDSSTNLLLRPDGRSGSLVSLYGGMRHTVFDASMTYNVDTGFIEHYEGLQYQRHDIEVYYQPLESARGFWGIALSGGITRFGEVTVLEGYEEYGALSTAKYYLTPLTLVRWEVHGMKRSYRDFPTEDFDELETFLRLDRFFPFGLTLRAQVDTGVRRYSSDEDAPSSTLFGLRFRAAKSLGPQWGIWAETFTTDISFSDTPADTTGLYDRIFLDDPYKYSKYGLILNTKYLPSERGSIQLRTGFIKRTYDDALSGSYWYLPSGGWEENEISAYLTLAYLPSWFEGIAIPSVEVYYIDVDASIAFLSYRSFGATVRFER